MPQGQDTLRLLVSKMEIPSDAPLVYEVVSGAVLCLCAYFNSLKEPCKELISTVSAMQQLQVLMDGIDVNNFRLAQNPLHRRLSKYPNWALLIKISQNKNVSSYIQAFGAKLALSLLSHKKLTPGFANELRTVMFDNAQVSEKFLKTIHKLMLQSAKTFELNANVKTDDEEISLEHKLINYFKARQFYADDKTHQNVLDHDCLNSVSFKEMAQVLSNKVASHDHTAILTCMASVAGIPLNLLMEVPFLSASLEEWVICFDANTGCFMIDLTLISPSGYQPVNTSIYVPASKILVKPIPNFVFHAVNNLIKSPDSGGMIGDILSQANCNSRESIITTSCLIKPTYARFLNSVGRIAVFEGVEPLMASLISTDFRILPKSKTYYRLSEREEIWTASACFYNAVGWGEPTPFQEGLAVGSSVVVKNEQLRLVFVNLAYNVENTRPSKRASREMLIEFHNHYAFYVASLAVFLLALRNRNPLKILASHFSPSQQYICINDKANNGASYSQPVAISMTLHQQLNLWIWHCECLYLRLQKMGLNDSDPLMKSLKGIFKHKPVPLFMVVDRMPRGISTADLQKTWSEPLEGNFSRHFWQTHFPKLGLTSREIDAQLRHQHSGNLNWSASSDLVLSSWIKKVSTAQESILAELNIRALPGMARTRL